MKKEIMQTNTRCGFIVLSLNETAQVKKKERVVSRNFFFKLYKTHIKAHKLKKIEKKEGHKRAIEPNESQHHQRQYTFSLHLVKIKLANELLSPRVEWINLEKYPIYCTKNILQVLLKVNLILRHNTSVCGRTRDSGDVCKQKYFVREKCEIFFFNSLFFLQFQQCFLKWNFCLT